MLAAMAHAPRRRGFALVEVVLALVLLAVGALALVGATGMALRSANAADSQSAAATAARNRVEMLAARQCATLADSAGADSATAIRERWTVTASRNGTRLVTDSVTYADQTGRRTIGLERVVVC